MTGTSTAVRPADRRLGRNQLEFLELMAEHRSVWHPGSHWAWKAPSETLRMLEALGRRGYTVLGEDGKWRVTPAGRRAVADERRYGGRHAA